MTRGGSPSVPWYTREQQTDSPEFTSRFALSSEGQQLGGQNRSPEFTGYSTFQQCGYPLQPGA